MYLKSAFNYTGSKFQLLEQLHQHFPSSEEIDVFWDVFAGGGSVFVNSNYKRIIANDIVTPLIDFYKELKTKSFEEIKENLTPFILDKTDQEAYLKLREEYNQTKDCYIFFSLVQSCTNNMMRFNKKGEFNQTWGKRTYNPNTEKKLFDYWERIQSLNVKFLNKEYLDLLPLITENGVRNFVYLDPPYFSTGAAYNIFWSKKLEEGLYTFLDTLNENNVKFAFSGVSIHKGEENPYLHRLKKYKIIDLKHNYDKVARIKDEGETKEMLVINY